MPRTLDPFLRQPIAYRRGSDLRQVPDNQEVFMYPENAVSIVFEILQAVDEQDRIKAARQASLCANSFRSSQITPSQVPF
jgi:hypothetical protein